MRNALRQSNHSHRTRLLLLSMLVSASFLTCIFCAVLRVEAQILAQIMQIVEATAVFDVLSAPNENA